MLRCIFEKSVLVFYLLINIIIELNFIFLLPDSAPPPSNPRLLYNTPHSLRLYNSTADEQKQTTKQ